MKYKVLLIGKNQTVIDDFFTVMEDIEPLTSSLRFDDIVGHIKWFEPDALCYCASNELLDNINQMVALKIRLEKENIPLIVVGSEKDCMDFSGVKPDLSLQKPLTASMVEEKIVKLIKEIQRLEAERIEEEQKKLEEEQKKLEEANRRKHVLVIDDDSTMLKAIKEQLHDQYDVATAINGKIAFKFLEKKSTDLILLDYEMPTETGPEVLEKLRANVATKDIPVIFLTGVTEKEKIMQVVAMKPQGYLLKPIEHDKLLAAIEDALTGEKNDE